VIDLLRLCSVKLALSDNSIKRRLYKLDTEPDLVETLILNSRDIVWRLTELINFLVSLAELSDKFKYEMYECGDDHTRHSLQLCLNRILFNGNVTEKEHVLKLIWKLTSDARIACAIKKDIDLYSYIIGLSLNMHNKSKNLLRYSNYILFALNTHGTQPPSCMMSSASATSMGSASTNGFRAEHKYNASVYSSPSMNRKSFQDHEYLKI
jgi:hypothetical protein